MDSRRVGAIRTGARRGFATSVVAALVGAGFVSSTLLAAEPQLPPSAERQVTVMSRNVYHGVDAEIMAVPSATGLLDLLQKVTAVYQGYHARNFLERAQAIAAEVDESRPLLIGLQEAVLVRTDTPADGPATPAQTVDLDFVQILLDALAARGLAYKVVMESVGFDVELPTLLGFDLRHTDREVLLARSDLDASQLKLSNPTEGHFAINCVIPSATLGSIAINRGWVSVDARVRGKSFRFVSTHLDGDCLPFTSAIQQAQAAEIVSGAANTSLPVVVVGDLNAVPDGSGAAYNVFSAAGFQDAWTDAGTGAGFTCCQADDLLNANSMLSERLDDVLFRGGTGLGGLVSSMSAVAADVVGEDPADRTPSGLWPSDHAGVTATLVLEQP